MAFFRAAMLSPTTRVLLALALIGCTWLALRFARKQNQPKARGGRISRPKIAWLFYAVFLWFFVCPLVALDPSVHPALRFTLGIFSVVMWLRGVAELYMLYVSHNWRPPYGVGHDVCCIVLVFGALAHGRVALGEMRGPADLWVLGLVGLVLVSLCVEVAYALLFFHAVEGRTTGEEGVWFADQEQARFQRINRITTALNAPLYAALALFLLKTFTA